MIFKRTHTVIDNKGFETNEFINDKVVISETNDMVLLYSLDKNELYEVDENTEKIKKISIKEQQSKLEIIKQMIDNYKVTRNKETINIQGKGKEVILNCEVQITNNKIIKTTAFPEYFKFSQQTSLVEFSLERDELIKELFLKLSINGKVTKIKTSLIEIKEMEDISRYNKIISLI